MSDLSDNRLVKAFDELRAEGRQTLLPFVTAGYPDVDVTLALLQKFEAQGARVCELGLPFSDPIADGPTIQASYTAALEDGLRMADIFQMVKKYRKDGGRMALLAMGSYSIVYRHGVQTFLDEAAEAGFDGLIVPDLSLEEAESFESAAADRGLCNVMLIAPTSRPERRLRIASHSRGFIYFISVAGVTGERNELPQQTIDAVKELRNHTDTPICVGFGISRPDMVKTVCEVADGAIVGSAIVHRITDGLDGPVDRMVNDVGRFVGELLAPLRRNSEPSEL
ncbi:MAG: tryptophan synthase subunit alpha [Phycisphaerae bacterium]